MRTTRSSRLFNFTPQGAAGSAFLFLWALSIAISSAAGAQAPPVAWTSPGLVDTTDLDPVTEGPALAVDNAGNWVAVWSSNSNFGQRTGADRDLFFSTSSDDGLTWSTPAPLNTNARSDGYSDDLQPSLATDGDDGFVAVWTVDGIVNASVSTDSGTSWSGPARQMAGESPDVAMSSSGVWVVIAVDSGNIVVQNSLGASATIGDVVANSPSVAIDNDGTWVAAFELGLDIGIASSRDNGGTWSAVTRRDTGKSDGGPFVAYDPEIKAWIVLWSTDSGVAMSVSSDGGDTWSSAKQIVAGANVLSSVSAATDGQGAWVLVYSKFYRDTGIAYSASRDNARSWDPARIVADTVAGDETPDIATDGEGQWIVVWEALEPTQLESRIFLATGLATTAAAREEEDGGPCFLASAAYGTPLAKDVEVLREMREAYLMNNAVGLFFVDAYYSVSPAIADQVAQYPWTASLVRALLIPVLFVVELFMRAPVPFFLMSIFVAAMIVRRWMTTRHAA